MSKKIVLGDCFEGDPDGRPLICTDTNFADGYIGVIDRDGEEFGMNEDICDSIPTLHLPIKGKWFDMILSGEKKEEYRDISTFYRERLCPDSGHCINDFDGSPPMPVSIGSPDDNGIVLAVFSWKPFNVLHLTNGYGHDKPQLWAKIESITIGKGNPEWGAPAEDVFIIQLGEVFHTKSLKP